MIYKKHTLCGFAVIIVLLLISIVLCFNVGRNRDDSFRQWSDIRKDSVINIGVLQNPVEYYVVRGKISGFSYELTSAMSEFLNLKPVYHIFANIEDAYMSVINGKIDILAAAEVRDVEMSALLDYTSAFWKTDIVLVQNKKSPVFSNKNCDSLVRDLPFSIGVTLPVSFYENAAVLLEKYPKNCSVRYYKFLPGFLLQEVEDNLLDLALVYLNHWKSYGYMFPTLEVVKTVKSNVSLHWQLRKGNDTLLDKVNAFLDTYVSTKEYKQILKKYMNSNSQERIRLKNNIKTIPYGAISEYDEHIKKYCELYDINWKLLSALIYQESKFNYVALGKGSTIGLMQFTLPTASKYGVYAGASPCRQIEGGCKYLNSLRSLIMKEGVWDSVQIVSMVLASYNAGSGHVKDAIALAKEEGLNPHVWRENVEKALIMLGEKKYYKKHCVKNGCYKGGKKTSRYVDEVIERSHHYEQLDDIKNELNWEKIF